MSSDNKKLLYNIQAENSKPKLPKGFVGDEHDFWGAVQEEFINLQELFIKAELPEHAKLMELVRTVYFLDQPQIFIDALNDLLARVAESVAEQTNNDNTSNEAETSSQQVDVGLDGKIKRFGYDMKPATLQVDTEKLTDAKEINKAAQFLIMVVDNLKATSADLSFGDLYIDENKIGDWEVSVRKLKIPLLERIRTFFGSIFVKHKTMKDGEII